MNSEMLALLLSALLCLLLPLIYSFLYQRQVGISGTLGNRETIPPPTGAAARGRRAHWNLLENLLPFAIVVLAAQHLAISNQLTVLGAWVFVGARVLHALCYLFGMTVIRSLAYLAGLTWHLVDRLAIILMPVRFAPANRAGYTTPGRSAPPRSRTKRCLA